MKARSKVVLGLVAIAALGFAVASTVTAGDTKSDKKGSNVQEMSKGAKMSATTRAIQDLALASQLIRYGRQEKNGESLLLAAQILHKTSTKPLKVAHKATGKEGDKPAKMVKANNSPKALLAEAKKISSGPQLAALAMATEKLLEEDVRGAVGGPKVDNFTIGAFQTINWNPINFRAEERAEVFISTGVNSRMILEIIDENNNVVVRDNVPGNYYHCVWSPRWTGPFRLRLVSNDNLAFNCRLATN